MIKGSTEQNQMTTNGRMRIKKKSSKSINSQKASRNITLMVIFQSFLYVLGR